MVTETGRTIFGEPIPIEEERRRVGLPPKPPEPKPEPEPERKPLLTEEEMYPYGKKGETLDPTLQSLWGKEKTQEYIDRTKTERIIQAHRRRTEEAKKLAKRKEISVTEALSEIGAPIPQTIVKQAKKRREAKQAEAPLPNTIRVGVRTATPEIIFVTPEIKNLQQKHPKFFKILKEQGIDTYSKAINAERFVYQESKRRYERLWANFQRDNTQLPDGEWLSKKDMAAIKADKEHPELYQIITAKGYEPYLDKVAALQKVTRVQLAKRTLTQTAIRAYVDPKTNEVDVVKMVNDGWTDKSLKDNLGLTKKEIDDARYIAKFEKAAIPEKMYMAAEKDPATFFKNVGISLIPVYGTTYFWKTMKPHEQSLMIAGDLLFIVPLTVALSAGVKGGVSLGRSLMITGRGVLLSPYTAARHPIQTIKTIMQPIETLLRPKQVPLAAIWRGEYSPAAVLKVGAGKTPRVTRDAMAEVVRLATEGKPARVVLPTGEVIAYSDTGLQKVLGASTVHSTPFGATLAGKGFKAEKTLFTSPAGSYKLSQQTAFGATAKYIIKGKDIVGDVGSLGKIIDSKGKIIGQIKTGTNVIGRDGKVLGKLDNAGYVMKDGVRVAKLERGGIAVSVKGKPQTLGWLEEGAKAISAVDPAIAIGKTKGLPTMAVIRTAGIKEFPQWILDAKTIDGLERKAEKALRGNKLDPNLYPLYKRWKAFIEEEAVYPKGTRLIPVVKQGKPVILTARGIDGKRILIPLLQEVDPNWFKQSVALTKTVQGTKVKFIKPLDFSTVPHISHKSAIELTGWFQKNPKSTIYGSFAEWLQVGKKIPADVDVAVISPRVAARELRAIMDKTSKVPTRIIGTPRGGQAVQVLDKGIWKTAFDLHPRSIITETLPFGLKASNTARLQGVSVEAISTQMARLVAKSAEDWGTTPLRLAQVGEKLGVKVNISMGAKPPTLTQLARLQTRGMANTVRDIFKKALTKSERLELMKTIAPDLAPDLQRLIAREKIIDTIGSQYSEWINADTIGKMIKVVQRHPLKDTWGMFEEIALNYPQFRRITDTRKAEVLAKAGMSAREAVILERQAIRVISQRLRLELRGRVAIVSKMLSTLPSRFRPTTPEARRVYASLTRVTPVRPPTRAIAPPVRPARPPIRPGIVTPRPPRPPIEPIEEPVRAVLEVRKPVEPVKPPELPRPPRPPRAPRPPPKPVKPLKPPPPPPPPIITLPQLKTEEAKKRIDKVAGALTWRQGTIPKAGRRVPVWYVVLAPYKSDKDAFAMLQPPPGAQVVTGRRSAYNTIQQLTGKAPDFILTLDLGIQDIHIDQPERKAGKPGAIKFIPDTFGRTTSMIKLGRKKRKPKKRKGSALDRWQSPVDITVRKMRF